MKITDEMLREAAPHACTLWLESVTDDIPRQAASSGFERKMEKLMRRSDRARIPLRLLPVAAVIIALSLTVGTFAAESEWIGKTFHSTLPPADGPDFTISEAKDIEPVSEAHLALHELPYAPELREAVGGIDLYIGSEHPVSGHYGCEKHGDDSHFVAVKEQLSIQRKTCKICGHKKIGPAIETIETCLTDPDPEAYTFCDAHEACESFGKTAADFEGWTAVGETEYTEWEEDRSLHAQRLSPCTTHRPYAHDQVEQIRYAVTEYQCPDCPKIVPCAELQRRTVCYTLTEGLTYAAEPTY